MASKKLVADKRNYRIRTVQQAKKVANDWLSSIGLKKAIKLGLPLIGICFLT